MKSSEGTVKSFGNLSVMISDFKFCIISLHSIENSSLITMYAFTLEIRVLEGKPKSFSNSHFMSKYIKSFTSFRMPEDIIQQKCKVERFILKGFYLVKTLHCFQ